MVFNVLSLIIFVICVFTPEAIGPVRVMELVSFIITSDNIFAFTISSTLPVKSILI